MKFIKRLSNLGIRQDNRGMRALIAELAHDPATSCVQLTDIGSVAGTENFYFFFSEGEAALLFIDTEGKTLELAGEEDYCGDGPTWFSRSGDRPSPFSFLTSTMEKFLTAMGVNGHTDIDDYLSVLITNSNVGNLLNYYDVFSELKGAVFHKVKDMKIPVCAHGGKAEAMVAEFRDFCKRAEKFQAPYVNYAEFIKDKAEIGDKPDIDKKPFVIKETDVPAVTILEPVVDPKSLLQEMVGLDDLKNNLAEIVAYARFSKKVRDTFPKVRHQPVNLHTIIVGNPGTGKTTMCRIYGALLRDAGILSSGHTVMATRSSFVGQYFGTEEKRVRECLELAQGGCLFIDEAAQLFSNPHPHDPGRNVLQLMLQLLADEGNRDIAVVLALYANDKSLEGLYELNPGIRSRFPNLLTFPDYTFYDLLEIAHRKAVALGLTFTPMAWKKFCMAIRHTYETRDRNFANGREVMNLLQRCVINIAKRSEKENLQALELLRLTVHDIPSTPSSLFLNRKLGFY